MSRCVGCFKPAIDPSSCINCKYSEAFHSLQKAKSFLDIELPSELEDEIEYDLYCSLKGIEGKDADRMRESGLFKIIERCADTAVYLPKKRLENLDDMKVLLFNLEDCTAYMTNADVVIRLSQIHPDTLDGLRNDLPAYDYLAEKFIPNPLPFDLETLASQFGDSYVYTFTLPVEYLLSRMHHVYKTAGERRNVILTIDVGYSRYEGTIVIPRFDKGPDNKRYFITPNDDMIIYVSPDSTIPNDLIEPETSYVGFIKKQTSDGLFLDIYKEFEDAAIMGMYKLMEPILDDDMHPFEFCLYDDASLIKFPLKSNVEAFPRIVDKMQYFKDFYPLAVEAEGFFETLILFQTFGYSLVNFYYNMPESPVLLEGIRNNIDQPDIHAVMATIAVGRDGKECESLLYKQLGR